MNRHFCNEEMEKAIERHEGDGIPFCVIGIDLDGFKEVNDTWGHLMGDKILIHITSVIVAAVGSLGLLSRWGGDELLVLLPDCNLDKGMEIAWKLCRQVDQNPYSDDIHCTISSGVAQHRIGETATSLIHRSDAAMYKAKTSGKNCVMAANVT
jgi:diguanylate cyclase